MEPVFVFHRDAMERVREIRIFGCDAKKRATDDVGVVDRTFDSG